MAPHFRHDFSRHPATQLFMYMISTAGCDIYISFGYTTDVKSPSVTVKIVSLQIMSNTSSNLVNFLGAFIYLNIIFWKEV